MIRQTLLPLYLLTTAPGSGPRHHLRRREIHRTRDCPDLARRFHEKDTTAEIEVHPNGKFVYGLNRGHDSIVVYQRDPLTGALTFLQHAPCGGKTPSYFKIDSTGKWLLCAHQGSNTISVLPLDPATGLLGAPGSCVSSPTSICLLFGR